MLNYAFTWLAARVKGGAPAVERILRGEKELPAHVRRRENRQALQAFAGLGAGVGTVK